MTNKKEGLLLVLLILILFGLNFKYIDNVFVQTFSSESGGEEFVVTRIIDGDTLEIKGNESVRLLGINTPEKGEFYYSEAKNFLIEETLNKTILLEYGKDKKDLYGRTLAYVFVDGENVNKKLVEEGFANYYFPSGKDKYYLEFVSAWKTCLKNNKSLCETPSNNNCASCVFVRNIDVAYQEVLLENVCDFDCSLNNWSVKDEGRKKYVFKNFIFDARKEIILKVGVGRDDEDTLFWEGEKYVWTKTGDTLFLRDGKGKLVWWESVG